MWRIKLNRLLRRIQIHRRHYRYPAVRRRRAVLLLAAAAVISGAVMIRIEPEMEKMAGYMINTEVTEYLNTAIAERIKSGELDYASFVTLEKDSAGKVTALVTNMAKINVLQTEITAEVLRMLSDRMETSIKVPVGNIIGGTVLSGRGPNINIRILSVSNMSAKFSNQFISAGINQTRHQIVLNFTVDIDMLIPGGTVHDTVTSSMVVAETVIVGDVPDTYADISGGS